MPSFGSLAEQTAPRSGRADNIYDSDSDHWKLRREADAKLSQSIASVRASATSACDCGDGGPGKESTQLRAKHQKSVLTSNIADSLPDRSI